MRNELSHSNEVAPDSSLRMPWGEPNAAAIPAVAVRSDGCLEVFLVGHDNVGWWDTLWHIWEQTPGGGWSLTEPPLL